MARLIDANALMKTLEELMCNMFGYQDYNYGVERATNAVEFAPTVDAVPAEQFNTLKSLINGEWVDCKLVQEALDIDFATGLKMFDFSRMAEWNPAPLNGQKITTKFRLKNAVEVVRCKDCKYFVQGEPYDPCECMKWMVKFGVAYTTPDGYCHKAERKDNG